MSTRQRWRELESWFHRLDPLDTAERTAELGRLEQEHPDLHATLNRLFAGEGITAGEQAFEGLSRTARADTPQIGRCVGPYRLLRLLGEGGMGSVFEAEQIEHVHRRVALKLIRGELASQRVIARFQAERQSLAVMDHPHIAHVLDAGATTEGQPYFVMELVDGLPITEWARLRAAPLEQRVSLIVSVCKAVQHAHTKGVIHRDLKPSNVLVTEEDGEPVPKIIDFGIAKAIDIPMRPADADTAGLATRLGEIVGTPAYMSPEQASLGTIDVDTRSDVYALGVLLYELLVGEVPLPEEAIASLALDEICRQIREAETPRPSAQISRRGTVPDGGTTIERWSRRLRGDLDQVVLKALAKDREHRYESARDFADDLERFLTDRPVLATLPSLRYRIGKLVRRNRKAVAAGAVATALALGGLLAAAANWLDARRSERMATTALRTAESTTDFLVTLFEDVAPEDNPALQISARELLDRGASRLDRSFEEQPEVRSALYQTLGRVYRNLPSYPRSEEYLRTALDLRRQRPDADLAVAETEASLGEVVGIQERFEEAEALLTHALETRRRRLGEHPDTAESLELLASLLSEAGELARALPMFEEAVGIRRRLGDGLRLGDSLRLLGELENRRYEHDRAVELHEEGLALQRAAVGDRHLAIASGLMGLATALVHLGEWERAEDSYRQAVSIRLELAGEDSHDYAWSISMLAWCFRRQGKNEEAEPLMREGLRLQRRLLGESHSEVGQILGNLGRIVNARNGDPVEIEALYRESFEVLERASGPNHQSTAEALTRISRLRLSQSRLDEAEAMARDVLERLRASGNQHGTGFWYKEVLLGDILTEQGRYEKAEALILSGYERLLAELGDGAPSTQSARRMLDRLYRASGRPEE